MKQALAVFMLVVALALFAVESALPRASIDPSGQALMDLANGERTTHGLAPLKWSEALAGAAHEHLLLLVQQNKLSHQFPGEPDLPERASRFGALFSIIAENVAQGADAEKIQEQWMNSPAHRANVVDPRLDSVGIATQDRVGILFAVEDFSKATGELSLPEQEGIVAKQLLKRGLKLLEQTKEARQSCALDNGYQGNPAPSFVVHYATPDLQNLPNTLDQRIQSGKYHSAVVGACSGKAKIGFTPYRVAVMLFE